MVMKHKEYIIVLTPKWLIFILRSIQLETFSVLNSNKKNELMETILKFKNFDNISKFRFHWVIHSRVNKDLISLLNVVLLYSNMNGSMRPCLRKIFKVFKIASYSFFIFLNSLQKMISIDIGFNIKRKRFVESNYYQILYSRYSWTYLWFEVEFKNFIV